MTSLEFAELARRLSAAARQQGCDAPLFRSPPRGAGVDRALRRAGDGTVTVSVRLKHRPSSAVAGDMIDGILAANGSAKADAGHRRDSLWAVAEELLFDEQASRGAELSGSVVPLRAGAATAA